MNSSEHRKPISWKVRSALPLIIGSSASQVIVLASTFAVTFLYAPHEFGVYSQIVSIASVLAPVMTLSLESFIIPSGSDQRAKSLSIKGITILIVNAILIFFAILIWNFLYESKNYSYFLSPIVLYFGLLLGCLYGIYAIVFQLVLREREFKKLAFRGPIQNSSIGIFQISCHFTSLKIYGLVIGEIFGRIIGIASLIPSALRIFQSKNPILNPKTDWKPNREPIWRNFLAIASEIASISFVVLFIAGIFGNSESGQFALAQRIINFPVVVLGAVLAQFLLATGSAAMRQKSQITLIEFDVIMKKLLFTGIFLALSIYLFAPVLTNLFLGDQWIDATEYVRYLSPFLVISFVWNPISTFFYIYMEWGKFLFISFVRLITMILIGIIINFLNLDMKTSIILFALGSSVIQVFGLFLVRKIVKNFVPFT
ncbi:RfbX Membrane protein involved in the export of O-antigen and teichoic acid [actinobacterium SCGC AAA044-D11]